MARGAERYRAHKVWETLRLKRESLHAARFDDKTLEQWRVDVVEWLDEAVKTKLAQQPALYLSALDGLGDALNQLPVDGNTFNQYIAQARNGQGVKLLETALRALPLPPPKNLAAGYVELLDKEIEVRTKRLDELHEHVAATEQGLQQRLDELTRVSAEVEKLRGEIQAQREAIMAVSDAAQATIDENWSEALSEWKKDRKETDATHDTQALASIATLAATTKAGEALAEHAAGDLSAADWYGRASRERKNALWMRAGALVAFLFAGAVGYYIVDQAIVKNFDISVGGGILRAAVAVVIGTFGALLLRESSRHFREADTAEDVALSLKALAPFYANSEDDIRLAARVQLGEAVLVKNVLSRFSHRDAAKHAGEVNTEELPTLVKEATKALRLTESPANKP
ncbi:hypothetical protein EXU48_20725 [Occultella glacieicola]|uniref:Uncharacterized protein n=1 Tax=Occultella glacieicola TaxID=2518684 RepID=A0ABY2DYM0_9MICO|nr:hypothetical protein [Occultella glacieicola]TDE89585.1 hypothetical protein EXU48_20725 [Occultella glacieicola]